MTRWGYLDGTLAVSTIVRCPRAGVRVQEAEQAAQRRVVTGALQAAIEAPISQQEWQKGPHAEALALIESFARGQTGAPHGTALFALLDLGLPTTPDGAAQLLKQVGYWAAHLPNALVSFRVLLPA